MKFVLNFIFISGGEGDSIWCVPDVLVNVLRPGEDTCLGVIREVLPVRLMSLLENRLYN
jgi:hypothetical protein